MGMNGLAEAHALGIVHRHIKPSNLFVIRRADGSPWVKVLDFGISKAPAPDEEEAIWCQCGHRRGHHGRGRLSRGQRGQGRGRWSRRRQHRGQRRGDSGAVYLFERTGTSWTKISYGKASNTGLSDSFGINLALDAANLVVGARHEDSAATGVNGNQEDNSTADSGAVYLLY